MQNFTFLGSALWINTCKEMEEDPLIRVGEEGKGTRLSSHSHQGRGKDKDHGNYK